MGKFTISMVMFHSYVTNYQRVDVYIVGLNSVPGELRVSAKHSVPLLRNAVGKKQEIGRSLSVASNF